MRARPWHSICTSRQCPGNTLSMTSSIFDHIKLQLSEASKGSSLHFRLFRGHPPLWATIPLTSHMPSHVLSHTIYLLCYNNARVHRDTCKFRGVLFLSLLTCCTHRDISADAGKLSTCSFWVRVGRLRLPLYAPPARRRFVALYLG
jgi:hypothetical protein